MNRVAFVDGDRRAGTVDDARAARGADTIPGGDDAGEVERIGGRDLDLARVRGRAPHFAQPFDRARQGELLTRHAGDKASAADFTTRFEAAIDAGQVAPWRGQR